MKGWLISSSPDSRPGESTPWHGSLSEFCLQRYPIETQVVRASFADASNMLRLRLSGGHSAKAGYLANAFRQTGRGDFAAEILRAMKGAGYDVRESSPFEAGHIFRRLR